MKKNLFIFLAIGFAALPFLASAQTYNASDTITLPPGFVDGIWSQAGFVFTSLAPYTNMIVGVLLALIVVGEVISLLRQPNK